jgi:hypothetical protein
MKGAMVPVFVAAVSVFGFLGLLVVAVFIIAALLGN